MRGVIFSSRLNWENGFTLNGGLQYGTLWRASRIGWVGWKTGIIETNTSSDDAEIL
jgi:hypothetical protein